MERPGAKGSKKRRPSWAALFTAVAAGMLWLRWGWGLPKAAHQLLLAGAYCLWELPTEGLEALLGLLLR